VALIWLGACGSNPAGPTDSGSSPEVSGVSPSTGSTLGGTPVAIAGGNFTSGASVTIGGVPATRVVVVSATEITAITAQHAAGSADILVVEGTHSARLPGAFTYVAPNGGTNTPPVIQSIVAQGTKAKEPPQFADLGETVNILATVTDKETSPDLLEYQWAADLGTLAGAGKLVTWTAPSSGKTPLAATIRLTVIEKYQTTDANGLPVNQENRVLGSTTVAVHDSMKEVGDMATLFLVNFSKTEVPVATVMQDFSSTCRGTVDETSDVQNNRKNFIITSWDVLSPQVSENFGAGCPTLHGVRPGDACSNSQVRWDSTEVVSGNKDSVKGVDEIAAVYVAGRWWLCSSDFDGYAASGARFNGWKR
jgi:hypothetical protein